MIMFLILSALTTWLVVRQYRKASRLPPGPISLPLIGNLPQIVYYLWSTGGISSCLDHFRKRYGNIFTLWVGPIPHVSICEYETSYEVFVKNGNKHADKFNSPFFTEIQNNTGVVGTNGDHWQEMRRFALQTFRNMGVGKDLMEVKIMEELNARCADLDKSAVNGVTTAHAAEFFDLTVGSVINSILLQDDTFEMMTPVTMILPTWVLRTFLKDQYKNIKECLHAAKEFASEDSIQRYKKLKAGEIVIDENSIHDYTDAFLFKVQKDGEDKNFNIETLKTMLFDLWTTGQETTTTTLISGFNQLLLHPEVMDKAREEIMKVTENGSRHLSLTDRPSTIYLNAVIGEIQRHASILNVNFWKYNYEPTYMGGHFVDSGALVTAQLGAIHVNETIFKDPREFDPDRFIRDEKLLQKVIPFGLGKRSCLGEALARAELYLIIGNLLLRYKFKPHGKLSTTELFPYSFAKRPFKLDMQFIKI